MGVLCSAAWVWLAQVTPVHQRICHSGTSGATACVHRVEDTIGASVNDDSKMLFMRASHIQVMLLLRQACKKARCYKSCDTLQAKLENNVEF